MTRSLPPISYLLFSEISGKQRILEVSLIYKLKTALFTVVFLFILLGGVRDSCAQSSLSDLPEDDLIALGYLDITLYGADPTGKIDSTAAIQKAINDSYQHRLVTFFPNQPDGERGVYLISDTLIARNSRTGIFSIGEQKTHVLIGSAKGLGRPLIKLKANLAQFSDSANPQPAIHFWASPYNQPNNTNPLQSQDDVSFDQLFRGIDIDLNGNPGAIGIMNPGAQGSAIEDTHIDATGAFAGIRKFGVLGSLIHNVEVEGGLYGIYVNPPANARSAHGGHGIVVGSTFRNQERALIYTNQTYSPIVFVGVNIVNARGPIHQGGLGTHIGISFIDSVIEVQNGELFSDFTNVFLRNVYLSGAATVAHGWRIDNPEKWTWILEYLYTSGRRENLVNGERSTKEYGSKVENVAFTKNQLISQLINKHRIITPPSFEDEDVVNLKDMGQHSARGDGITDDTQAIQYAIDNFIKILVPKGIYAVKDTIHLKKDTQLFGVDKTFTEIVPHPTWVPRGEQPIIRTADDKNGSSYLADLRIVTDINLESPGEDGFTPVEWRVGRNSIMRHIVASSYFGDYGGPTNYNFNRFRFSESGGGRHFGIFGRTALYESGRGTDQTRGIMIDGTKEPLYIYAYNNAVEPLNIVGEIIDSKNITFYRSSHEGARTVYRIANSENIAFYGGHKNTSIGDNRGGFEIIDCMDVLIADYAFNWRETTGQHALIESIGGDRKFISNNHNIALYKRGEPDFAHITEIGSRSSATKSDDISTFEKEPSWAQRTLEDIIRLSNYFFFRIKQLLE